MYINSSNTLACGYKVVNTSKSKSEEYTLPIYPLNTNFELLLQFNSSTYSCFVVESKKRGERERDSQTERMREREGNTENITYNADTMQRLQREKQRAWAWTPSLISVLTPMVIVQFWLIMH